MGQQPEASDPDHTSGAAPFESILLPGAVDEATYAAAPSDTCLRDLGLAGIVDAAASSPDSRAVFLAPLRAPDAIRYRQEVMRDLEEAALRRAVEAFRTELHAARVRLAGEQDAAGFPYGRERAVLDGASRYVGAVSGLAAALARAGLASRGLASLERYLSRTVASAAFRSLAEGSRRTREHLGELSYTLLVEGRSVTVGPASGSGDLAGEIARLFGRFFQGPAPAAEARPSLPRDRSGVQAQILRRLAARYPEPFEELTAFAERHRDFVDPTLLRVDRELGFYLDYLAVIAPLRKAGLPFCYPAIGTREEGCICRSTFDLALGRQLVGSGRGVIPNDVEMRGDERIMVVTGPNQGGKTTYARTFGQLHFLAALGCPVPGSEARLAPFDLILTHFERGEAAQDLRGKLAEELTRVRDILEAATPESLVVLNETFSSTPLADALFLGGKLLGKLSQLDLREVFVTFADELSTFDAKTVSMVCTVDAEDPTIRTFKLLRRPADGAAHALAIARKHRVTYEQILERVEA